MPKRLKSNSVVAFTYYVGANLVSLVPSFIAVAIIDNAVKSISSYILLQVVSFSIIYYFSLAWSAKNITKSLVIVDKRAIRNWSIGYLLVINSIFLVGQFLRLEYISANTAALFFNTCIAAVSIYVVSSKYLINSTHEEIELVKKLPPTTNKTGKRLLRIALLTVGGFVFLLIVPFLGYVFLSISETLSLRNIGLLLVVYEIAILVLGWKFLIKKRFND